MIREMVEIVMKNEMILFLVQETLTNALSGLLGNATVSCVKTD